MSSERRYSEKEIAAIFKQASAAQEAAQRKLPDGELTLTEIEEIGAEAGISPEFIARAAATVDRKIQAPSPAAFLGLPVSVARVVDLPGSFTDADWDRLVADIHETFQEHGEVRLEGSLRQWQNENLQVLVEPAETGHRLRIRTQNDNVKGGLIGSLAIFLMGLFFLLILGVKGDFVEMTKTLVLSLFPLAGAGGYGASVYMLSRWRKDRERKMEAIVARAIQRSESQPGGVSEAVEQSVRLDLEDLPEQPAESGRNLEREKTR